jgi:hypothetical protein
MTEETVDSVAPAATSFACADGCDVQRRNGLLPARIGERLRRVWALASRSRPLASRRPRVLSLIATAGPSAGTWEISVAYPVSCSDRFRPNRCDVLHALNVGGASMLSLSTFATRAVCAGSVVAALACNGATTTSMQAGGPFACAEGGTCNPSTEFCQLDFASSSGPFGQCLPLPSACLSAPSCACILASASLSLQQCTESPPCPARIIRARSS